MRTAGCKDLRANACLIPREADINSNDLALRSRILSLSRYLIQIFLFHASIVRPLGESGKLKLTTDMTELEIAISSLLTTGQPVGARSNSAKALKLDQIGDEYLALRSFRTILFSDLATLANPVETVHLPPLVVLHHIIVQSGTGLRLPHEVHVWSEVEYVAWVMKHEQEEERLDLLEKAVEGQVQLVAKGEEGARGGVKGSASTGSNGTETFDGAEKTSGTDADADEVYVKLIREVLHHARHVDGTPAPGA